MRRKLWKIREINPRAKSLAKDLALPFLLVQVLLNRGIKEEDFSSFLTPKPVDFRNPFLLPDIEKGAKRIKQAIDAGEKVLVFGDYDVDGVTSLAIFHEFAGKFPGIFSFYIPHRIKEGYGLNREAILWAKKRSFSLIVAFDCGTNAQQEVELAATLGIDIVIVDHHHIKHVRPGSFAFINPKRKDSSYPFSDLSAGALSFKLLQVLTGSDCYDVLDLVALSLVCDVVPLRGENRSLLKEGLKAIRRSSRACIKALCKVGRIEQGSIDTFHIGYILGPRINASGRVAHADESLKLFLAEDEKEAYDYALKLGKYNKQRRVIEAEILKQAEQKVQGNVKEDKAIVVSGDDWHQGVLGIVASRLANKYYRPSFVISFDQDKGKGSARSTVNVHLIEMLDKCSDMLLLYGGHSKAAGIQIDREKLSNFKERINSLVEKNLTLEDFIPAIDIDAVLSFKDIDMVLVEDLQKLAPYGEANAKPLFAAYNVSKKSSPNKINSYFSLWLSDGEKTFEGIIYDKDILEIIKYADTFNIVFSLEKNHYHNIPKLIIRDCRLLDGDG